MTETNDVLARLKAANPIQDPDTQDLSPMAADTLFDRITSRSGGFTPYAESAGADPRADRFGTTDARSSSQPRRWGLLSAVAAAAVLLIGALVIVAPAGTEPALAVVQAAAADTAEARSGRVVTEFNLVGHEEAEEGTVSGTMTAIFAEQNYALSVDVDPSSNVMSAEEVAEIAQAETRLVDGTLYATTDGEQWMSIEAPEILQTSLARLTDLRTILAEVENLVEVEVVGSADIDGLSVTQYRSEIDLADESLAESGWLPGTQGVQGSPVDIDAEGLVTVDLFVDDNGLMRRIQVSGQAEPVDETIDASADFAVTTNFVDLDSDITIEAPDPALVETLEFEPGSLDG